MEQTRLGVSIGLFAAGIYFAATLNTLAMIVLVGYVLLFEGNAWLRRSAVKAVILSFGLSLLPLLISTFMVPLGSLLAHFDIFSGLSFYYGFVNDIIDIVRVVMLCLLGLRALTLGSISTANTDNLISRHCSF